MKSITTALLTLGLTCGLAISGFCHNEHHHKQPMDMEPTGFRDAFKGSPNRVSLGLDFHHVDEELHNSVLSDPDGNQWGFSANYDYHRDEHIYFGLALTCSWGDLGSDQDLSEVDAQARVGYTWVLGNDAEFFVAPFIGLGYHAFDNTLETSSGDLDQDHHMAYVPIGFHTGWWINSRWELGFNAQWRWGIAPMATALGASEDIEYDLEFSNGWEFELPITYRFDAHDLDGFDLRLVPYYKSATFGDAEALSTITKTTYEEWGARLELGYRF